MGCRRWLLAAVAGVASLAATMVKDNRSSTICQEAGPKLDREGVVRASQRLVSSGVARSGSNHARERWRRWHYVWRVCLSGRPPV